MSTTKPKKKVAVFLEMAGINREGTLSGPYAGAKSFISAIQQYSDHDVTFFSTKVTDPQLLPHIDTRNYFNMPPSELEQLLSGFDAVHVLNGKKTALKIAQATNDAIMGTNVVFGVPFRNRSEVDPQILIDRAAYIAEEDAITRCNWSYILTPNQNIRPLYEARFTGKYDGIVAMPFGIDTNVFKPNPSATRKKIVWIGGGPNRPGKGGALIEEVQALLPQYDWVLLGKDKPFKHGEQIPLLQEALVYVVTTAHETQGLATFEAMACGAPVVIANYQFDAKDGQGYREQTPVYHLDGITSKIAKRNAASIAKAIEELVQDTKQRENLGTSGRQHIEQYFSLEALARQYDTLIDRLITEKEEHHNLATKAKQTRDTGKYQESIDQYTTLIASEPHNPHLYYFRATAHFAIGHYEQAREDANRVHLMAPGHSSANNLLQKIEQTIIQKSQDNNIPLLIEQAKELRNQKQYHPCLAICKIVTEIAPDNHHAHYFAATAHEALGQLPEALQEYQLAGRGSSAQAGRKRIQHLLLTK